MENYIFNDNTIAIIRSNNKTIIIDVDKIRVINISISKVIDNNCLLQGFNYNGRKEAIKRKLKVKYKVPIYIKNNVILLQLNSIRNKNCIFLILNKIIDYYYKNNRLYIKCKNNYVFMLKISINNFKKIIINGLLINNIFNN